VIGQLKMMNEGSAACVCLSSICDRMSVSGGGSNISILFLLEKHVLLESGEC